MESNLLSVIVLAYNHEKYLDQTLKGILSQKTSFPFKVLITDDGSTDRTRLIINSYIDTFPNRIIPVFNEHNIGLNETLKKVILLIDTKYACFLGGDDYWIDDRKLQKQIDILESHPEISFIHTGVQYLDDESGTFVKIVNNWQWKMPLDRNKRLISFLSNGFKGYPCASTSCFRTKPFLDCYNAFPQLLNYGVGEGTLLHASMCMYGDKYCFLPDITTVYRLRNNSLSHFRDEWSMINFQIDYLRLKILTFNLFHIPYTDYHKIVTTTLDLYLVKAYLCGCLEEYRVKIEKIGLKKGVINKYRILLSSRILTFLYVTLFRIQDKLKSFFK